MKKCVLCEEVKPLNEFYTHKSNKDKKHSYCKECIKENTRKSRRRNRVSEMYSRDLHHNYNEKWTIQELAYISVYYNKISRKEISLQLGRTAPAIYQRHKALREKGEIQKYQKMYKELEDKEMAKF